MRRSVSRPLALLLALTALSCKGDGPAAPPDSAECASIQATFTVVAPPVTFDEIGTLTTASCKLGRGSYADRWELVVSATVDVEIQMTSDDVDSYIILRDSDDERIGSNDDAVGGGGFNDGNSLLAGRIQAGTYYIMTTTYHDDAVGDYSLSVTVTPVPIP